MIKKTLVIGGAIAALLFIPEAHASALKALTITNTAAGVTKYSVSLQVLIFMTLLSFIPALLLTMTSFARIIIVLSILRQAIGLNSTPTNQILIGISLFLTLFIMMPTFNQVNQQSVQPYLAEKISAGDALIRAKAPFRKFMLRQIRTNDLALFSKLGGYKNVQDVDQLPLTVLMPAFLTSELKTAFQIGFLLFIPFLIIDIVVASVLMAMGMMMLSPLIISLPFKVMLFVLIDGWTLVIGSLATSFR